jgi:hypothetical protein
MTGDGAAPWLSVVVPVHDGAGFLGATLAAAAAERPEGVEFLLYDSGNDNGAAQRIAEGFADRLIMRWHATPEMKPWTAKTNRGVAEARAAHVAMLHQDDLWLPGHLTALRAAIAEAPAAPLSIGPSQFVSAADKAVGHWRLPFSPGLVDGGDFRSTLIVQNSVAIPSSCIRRDAWLACGGLDEALWYTADWDLYLKLAAHGPVLVRPVETTAFRIHGSSLTMTGSRDIAAFRAQLEAVMQRHESSLPARQRAGQLRLARASIAVNCALAAGVGGGWGTLWQGIGTTLGLGANLPRFLRETRLVDRSLPRLRLVMAGRM